MILHDLINYEVLRLIWWLLLGVLLIGFAVTDGFDLGVATLLPFVGGRTWNGGWHQHHRPGVGRQSGVADPRRRRHLRRLAAALCRVLIGLLPRHVRHSGGADPAARGLQVSLKRTARRWRKGWDWALFVGGFVPALIFGVAVGNTLQGVPFRLDEDLRIFYDGSFFGLLNPFALLCGLLSVAMLVTHGAPGCN